MSTKFGVFSLVCIACILAPLLLSNAASTPRRPSTQLPIGKPLIVNMQADAITEGGGAYNGTIMAYDDQWTVLRIGSGKIIWCPTAGIANIMVDASVLGD